MRCIAVCRCQDTTAFSQEQRIYFIDHIERLFGFVSRGAIAFTDVIYTCYLNSRATTRKQQLRTVKVKIVGFMIVSCYRWPIRSYCWLTLQLQSAMGKKIMESPIIIGVSSCLLGNNVRYNGGHAQDRFITGTLGGYVEFVPVCPEVGCGLGVP